MQYSINYHIVFSSESVTQSHALTNTIRGYTGHEHLPHFALINMNGRMYDPVLGRMLSPDNYVQDPNNAQNYNRYAYVLNNPLKYTDPSGEFFWVPVIVGAVIGAYSGGVIANNDYDPSEWDWESGRTWRYIIGGAIVGGVSGYVGAAVAASEIPMANTLSIMASSFTYSLGTNMYTGDRTDIFVSMGVASYNFTKGELGYLGKSGNSTLENIGYAIGLFANLTDAWAYYKNAYNSHDKLELQTSGHSQTYDPQNDKTFSWGSLKDKENNVRWERTPRNAFRKLPPIKDYPNDAGWTYRTVEIDHVNLQGYYNYIENIPEDQFYRMASLIPIKGMHCTIATSRALLAGGVFNIPILRMPWLLDLQMRIRSYSYLSYTFYSVP